MLAELRQVWSQSLAEGAKPSVAPPRMYVCRSSEATAHTCCPTYDAGSAATRDDRGAMDEV